MAEQRIVPLTCHGHSRPVTHINFSSTVDHDQFYMISGCKDNNPMLRDGITGDWIGTFIGHKGAVWQARISDCATMAATASADFSAKIWDCTSGECLATLQHEHIVRTIAFPPNHRPLMVATGGMEKKLRIFDISQYNSAANLPTSISGTTLANGSTHDGNSTSSNSPTSPDGITRQLSDAGNYEVGEGVHKGAIKSVIWLPSNILVTIADDQKIRWFDIRTQSLLKDFELTATIGSCEMNPDGTVISVAAGKTAYFFSGINPGQLIKKIETKYDVSCVALHVEKRQFIVGGSSDTWVRIYDYDTGKELEVNRGHHGPVWTVAMTPDGKMYGTGSEDGTVKLWKFTQEPYGLWK